MFGHNQKAPAPQVRGQGYFLTPANGLTIAANGSETTVLNIDSDYLLTAIMGRSTGPFTLDIKDEHGRSFMNEPVHSEVILGTGAHPHYLNPFFVFRANSRLVFQFTDLSENNNIIHLTFEAIRQMVDPASTPLGPTAG